MGVDLRLHYISLFHTASRAISIFVLLVGVAVLAGWALDVEVLKSVIPGFATMKANTAIAFVFAGLSLWLGQENSEATLSRKRLALGAATVVVVVGVVTLSQYLFSWNLGIDQLLFTDSATGQTLYPGRMAPATALLFAFLGVALVGTQTVTGRKITQYLAGTSFLIAFMAVLGYLYGIESFYGFFSAYTSVAINTASTFIALALGIFFARPTEGYAAIFISNGPGGLLVRKLSPLVLSFMPILGWLRLLGEQAGLYPLEFGLGLMVLASTTILLLVIGRLAYSLDGAEGERKLEEGKRMRSTEGLDKMTGFQIDRELKMVELKKEIERLKTELGQDGHREPR